MAAKWFFGSGNAVVIKNGIQTSRFAYKPEVRMQIRTELDIPKNAFVIGHVGRFENEKNHSFLLDIFAVFAKAHPDARLMLIGRGVLMDAMKEKASSLGIADKVLFMGEQKNVNELLQAFDLFLMPSTFEGQPFVLIEAQCAGLPCLVSDVINDDICLTPNIRKLSLQQNAEEWSKQMTEMLNTFVRKDESMTLIQKGYDTSHTISYIESVYDGEL
jgi:glycosyltransferase involved in cell wall biosynthesis